MQRKPISKLGKPVATKPKVTPPSKEVPPGAMTKDWIELEKNLLICSGAYSQAHKRFKGYNQQSASCCIVACAFSALLSMNAWTKLVLDEILETGTFLHLKSRQIEDNKCRDHMAPPEIYKYFFLNNVKISMRVGVDPLTRRITRDSTLLEKITILLRDFFLTNSSGVFAHQQTYFAIWKFNRFFFLFDPTEHNSQGGKWNGLPGMGYCYCVRSTNLNILADIIVKNCALKQINKFVFYPCNLEKSVVINTKPPETLEEVKPFLPEAQKPKLAPPKLAPPKLAPPKVKKPKLEPPVVEQPPEVKKSISKSMIPPEKPKLQSVTNFVQFVGGTGGILRASTHNKDPKFTRYMGAQSLGDAIAALTMLRQYKSKVWIRKILDDILKLGEIIHHDSKPLPPGETPKKVTLNEQSYTPKIEKYGAVGRLESSDDKILNLEQAIANLLIDTDSCILRGPKIVAIWKEDKRYYMFDPEECDATGRAVLPGTAGVACVTWYTKPASLVAMYLNNLPKSARNDRFMLNTVAIKDYVPTAEDWYNFKALTFNKWILRGNFSQQDRRFPPESRNAQCTANATMALAFKELKREQEWSNETVNEVLINGDEFYRGCIQYLQECGKFKDKYLMVDELKRDFDVENKRVNLEIDDCLVNGIINAKSDTGIPNLKRGFEEFFVESDAGIVTANLQSMAVWRRDNTYYYYDSHSRNEKGVVCGYGTACILRMVTIEDLTNALMTNLGPDRQNLYNISRVVVKLIDLSEGGDVKPPLHFYDALNDLTAILRSNTSEQDKKFSINAGKQAVPMCLAALAFNTVTPSFDWTKEDLDEILAFGDKLYTESMEANYSDQIPEDLNVDEVTTNNVKTSVKIGPNSLELEFEEIASGNFEDNLLGAMERIEESILESEYLTVSMWRDDNLIYLFDPRPRDERGQVYGKDDWSAKNVEPDEPEEDEDVMSDQEDEVQKEVWEDDDDKDELAGGDNLGEPELEVKAQIYDDDLDEEEDEDYQPPPPTVVKKGSAFWRQKEEEGKACVLRFSRIDDLIQHLLENVPPNKRQEVDFSLKKVTIGNTPILHEVLDPEIEEIEEIEEIDKERGDWFEFKEVDYGKWILRSVRNLRDGLFPVGNRGKQGIPMCMVALAFASLYALSKFNQEVVNGILAYGDRLYSLLVKLRSKELKSNFTDEEIEEIIKRAEFKITDYPKNICMGEKLAKWEAQLDVIEGDTTSKVPETVPNVLSGLTTFFQEHQFGILVARNYPVAVWKTDDIYYMFDPHATGPSGVKSPIGTGCITRFKQLEDLTQIYGNNLPRMGNNFFQIHSFTFTKEECVRERHPEEKQEVAPKIGGFGPVMAGKEIIRGDVKLDCTKFDRGVNIHSAATAIIALALSLSKDPETWTRLIINEILIFGEDLHNDSIDKLGDKFNPWADHLDICRVNTDFKIGRLKVNTAIRFTEQRGIIDVKNSKTPNLRQGLERFFEENSHGVLVADKFILPIWEQMKEKEISIYMFDPNSRGPTGLPAQGGVPCVMKFCNAKVASDHIMACLMDIDKKRTEFAIVPVEIVIGSMKTKRKVCQPPPTKLIPPCASKVSKTKTPPTKLIPPSASKVPKTKTPPKKLIPPCAKPKPTKIGSLKPVTKRPPCPTPVVAKPVTCPDKTILMETKRILRQNAADERAREEAKRCALLGRNEIYTINSNESIIRGLRAVVKDRELPVNLVAFVFMKISPDLSKWNSKQIELVLEAGYQLYVDSYNAYKPETTKLSLQHVLRRVMLKDCQVKIDIKKPILSDTFTRDHVLTNLTGFFTLTNFCILSYDDYLVSIYFKSGYYYLFDPYSRDLNGEKTENGSAVLLRIGDLSLLVDRLLRNLGDEAPPRRYALIVVGITSVQPLGKST